MGFLSFLPDGMASGRITRDWPEEDHGPNTPIREYSLLQNPRTPAFVKTDKLDIRICKVRNPIEALFIASKRRRSLVARFQLPLAQKFVVQIVYVSTENRARVSSATNWCSNH